MKNKNTSIISVRVTDEVKTKLNIESDMNSITLNTLVSKILSKHVIWDRFAEDMGFIFLTKPFLRAILDDVDEQTITTIAVSTCRGAIRDAILYINGQFTIDSFLQVLDLWLGASHILFRHIVKNNTDRYVIQHDLNKKWSVYLITVIKSLLSEIGYHLDNEICDAQTVSFEIKKSA